MRNVTEIPISRVEMVNNVKRTVTGIPLVRVERCGPSQEIRYSELKEVEILSKYVNNNKHVI